MPIKEFRCPTCNHEHDELVNLRVSEAPCPKCGASSKQVFLTPPQIDWAAMGAQPNVSPEFIDRFERNHKKQLEKEKKAAAN